jgi:ribosomal protein S18 acetylase RimI-like enzyme
VTFIQLIEYRTTRPEEVSDLLDRWIAASDGKRTATRTRVGRARYVEVLEFPSYEQAQANSTLSETNAVHEEFLGLCEQPPTFVDLDVLRDEQL